MDFQLKPISRDGIPEAISKVELYRNLNEPGEAESICRDILAADPDNQTALRLLCLSITDQYKGTPADRYTEAVRIFQRLHDQYEQFDYVAIIHLRVAIASLQAVRLPLSVTPLIEDPL